MIAKSRTEETMDRLALVASNVEEVRAMVRAWDQEGAWPTGDYQGMAALVIDGADPVGAEVLAGVEELRGAPLPDGSAWHPLTYSERRGSGAMIFWIIAEAPRAILAGYAPRIAQALGEKGEPPRGNVFAVVVAAGGALLTTITTDGSAVEPVLPVTLD